ncbi:MAG: epoxide hydrolase family protein [Pseudonocardiaceae bacterium]
MARSAVAIEPMRVVFEPDTVKDLGRRLKRSRLPEVTDGWDLGVPGEWLAQLLNDWRDHDLVDFQERLGLVEHCCADIGGQRVHFIHVLGAGPDPVPLVLTHGWPSTFCELLSLVPQLTDPGRHGGDPADAFSVVVPSLPGFGFSAPPPPGGLTAAEVGELWHSLMVDGLGYQRYFAHGGDLGAGVTAWLARRHPGLLAAIHLATPSLAPPPRPWSPVEEAYFDEVEAWSAAEGGYAHQQATKPATLAVGLLDSPAGLAAWLGEKLMAWSSTDRDGRPSFPRRLLLDTLTIYWCTASVTTSFLPYWRYRHSPDAALPSGRHPAVPTAVSVFGGEVVPFPKPPRELAERYFEVAAWSVHDRGGHFPAVAEPQLLADDLRAAFRPFRHT